MTRRAAAGADYVVVHAPVLHFSPFAPHATSLQSLSARELAARRAEVVAAVSEVAPLRFVNGGGTGSGRFSAGGSTSKTRKVSSIGDVRGTVSPNKSSQASTA